MPRDKKGISRTSGHQRKDPTLFFVIASEGTETEIFYFEHINRLLAKHPTGRLIKVEPLRYDGTDSSFVRVIKQLDDYKSTYLLKEGDELWCLIDRDRIPVRNAAAAHQLCTQKRYEFCLSSPCFEIWLLLHLKDLKDFTTEELETLLKNPKVNASKTAVEFHLNEACKTAFNIAYRKNEPPPELLAYLPSALTRAFEHELEKKHWTFEDFCTRIHELVMRIFKAEPPDFIFPFQIKIQR